jgi:hypothetical protein
MRRLLAPAVMCWLALPAAPAAAEVRFEGRTGQGRAAIVVAEDDGVPKRVAIRWQASCSRSGFRVVETTSFRRPLDLADRRRIRDDGSYLLRDQGGERLTISVRISGRRAGPRRWTGRFRASAVVRRSGRVIDRCSVRGVRWRVRR